MATKRDLIESISTDSELYKYQVKPVVDVVFDKIAEMLRKEEKVEIRGFGTFAIKTRPSRVGLHPITQREIVIPETKRVVFKPSKKILHPDVEEE